MRKLIGSAVLVGALVLAGASVSAAQAAQRRTAYGVAGGLLMPMGDYGDLDGMGFLVGVGASFALGTSPVRLRVEGTWSSTSHDDPFDGNTRILGGMASVVYPFQSAGRVKPYILGGLGYYNVDVEVNGTSGDESKVGFGGGLGLLFPMASSDFFVEARYMSVSTDVSLNFVPIIVGIRFGK